MASQVETSAFPSVYQWETTDPVLGGLGGVANLPLVQLTARTRFSYDAHAALVTFANTLAPNNSPTLTGTPRAPTPVAGSTSTEVATAAFVRQFAGGVTQVAITGNFYLSADQAGAGIIVVVGSLAADTYLLFPAVPGRWTVLNATAGGFAVLTRLAPGGMLVSISNSKAQTVFSNGADMRGAHNDYFSVALSGIPTAPLAPDNDNSSQVAITAWVVRCIAEQAGALADGAVINANSHADSLFNTEAATRAAADQAEAAQRGVDFASANNARYQADLQLLNKFADYPPLSSFGIGNGYQRLPSGLIVQFGQHLTTNGFNEYVSLPVAFPNQILAIAVSEGSASGWASAALPTVYGTTVVDRSAFGLSAVAWVGGGFAYRAGILASYIAIGN